MLLLLAEARPGLLHAGAGIPEPRWKTGMAVRYSRDRRMSDAGALLQLGVCCLRDQVPALWAYPEWR
jgi:hypothetical protein